MSTARSTVSRRASAGQGEPRGRDLTARSPISGRAVSAVASGTQVARGGGARLGVGPSEVLELQRRAGNRATARVLGATAAPVQTAPSTPGVSLSLQRLARPSDLRTRAGRERKDVKVLGVRLRRMSTHYKAVLAALATYHDAIDTMLIFSGAKDRRAQAALLQRYLDEVIAKSHAYLAQHPDGPRTPAIQGIIAEATREKRAVDAIAAGARGSGPQQMGRPWGHLLAEVTAGFETLDAALQSGEIDSSVFHGTGSPFLGKFQGELLSGAELARRGVARQTGEGDLYSDEGGEKERVSVGLGAPGLGTALTYAKASSDFRSYNTARYTDAQLDSELRQLDTIVTNWRDDVLPKAQDPHVNLKKSKEQFMGLRKKLLDERRTRAKLPRDHPRRRGEAYEQSSYPLLLQFSSQGLDLRNPRSQTNTLAMDTEMPRPMGGERGIPGGVDLRDPLRLQAVWCPVEQMAEVRRAMALIVGHEQFTVIPLEAVDLLPPDDPFAPPPGPDQPGLRRVMAVTGTLALTTTATKDLYDNLRTGMLGGYERAMTTGEKVTDKLIDEVLRQQGAQ